MKKRFVLYALTFPLLAACSSGGVSEEVNEQPVVDVNDRITFSSMADEMQGATRATQLTTGFVVSTYKGFGLASQQTVMDRYLVEYRTSGNAWDGNQRPYWTYVGVGSQFEKFWDYSAFPYRFQAIAPVPEGSYVLTENALTLNGNYLMQTSYDGQISPADAEPFLVAQVQRNADGTDTDVFLNKAVNTGSTSRNRDVRLPFHHLNSKVRFGIYSTTSWTTSHPLYIKDLSIRVVSPDFVTQAGGYSVTSATGSWHNETGNSHFTNLVHASTPTTELLHYTGGKDAPGNDISHAQGPSSTFWLQNEQGIMQVPQQNVKMLISFELYKKETDELYMTLTDVPVKLADDTDVFQWKSGYFHTYNLIITQVVDKLIVDFTATLTPWEDVGGSLSTDLEK